MNKTHPTDLIRSVVFREHENEDSVTIEAKLELRLRKEVSNEALVMREEIKKSMARELVASIFEDRRKDVNDLVCCLLESINPLDSSEAKRFMDAIVNIATYTPPKDDD
jgi:hypothetical protein